MASFENGVIQIQLSTPLCVHQDQPVQRAMLEARLTRLLIDRIGDAAEAIAMMETMIDHWRPIPNVAIAMNSQCILEWPALPASTLPFLQDIFRHITDPEIRGRINDVRWENSVDTLRRSYKFQPQLYDTVNVRRLWYFFRGRIEAIEKVMRAGSQKFGPLRAKGGAIIESMRFDSISRASGTFGIVCGGLLVRPIPARCEQQLLLATGTVQYLHGMVENWRIPYFAQDTKELCLVPIQNGRHMTLPLSDIQELAH